MDLPVDANEMYPDLVVLAEKFGHRIEELCGVLRWDKTRNTQDLNKLAFDFQNGRVSLFDYMKTYMEIGYSLSGFEDVMTGLGQDFIDLAVRYDADMLRNAYWGNNQILFHPCSSQSPIAEKAKKCMEACIALRNEIQATDVESRQVVDEIFRDAAHWARLIAEGHLLGRIK